MAQRGAALSPAEALIVAWARARNRLVRAQGVFEVARRQALGNPTEDDGVLAAAQEIGGARHDLYTAEIALADCAARLETERGG